VGLSIAKRAAQVTVHDGSGVVYAKPEASDMPARKWCAMRCPCTALVRRVWC